MSRPKREMERVEGAFFCHKCGCCLADSIPQLVLADIKMPSIDGLEMLRQIRETYPSAVVIVMTGYSSLEPAIMAITYDASDYLCKPFDDPDAVLAAVERGLANLNQAVGK